MNRHSTRLTGYKLHLYGGSYGGEEEEDVHWSRILLVLLGQLLLHVYYIVNDQKEWQVIEVTDNNPI